MADSIYLYSGTPEIITNTDIQDIKLINDYEFELYLEQTMSSGNVGGKTITFCNEINDSYLFDNAMSAGNSTLFYVSGFNPFIIKAALVFKIINGTTIEGTTIEVIALCRNQIDRAMEKEEERKNKNKHKMITQGAQGAQGGGSILMDAIVNIALKNNFLTINLDAIKTKQAIDFYTRHGFINAPSCSSTGSCQRMTKKIIIDEESSEEESSEEESSDDEELDEIVKYLLSSRPASSLDKQQKQINLTPQQNGTTMFTLTIGDKTTEPLLLKTRFGRPYTTLDTNRKLNDIYDTSTNDSDFFDTSRPPPIIKYASRSSRPFKSSTRLTGKYGPPDNNLLSRKKHNLMMLSKKKKMEIGGKKKSLRRKKILKKTKKQKNKFNA